MIVHTQRAPTWRSLGTRWPVTWRATRDSRPPTKAPPMKAAGGWVASDEGGRAAISCSSNWITVGVTPMVARRFFMTWHMQQQEDRVKMMTGCSKMRRWIRVSIDSSGSMDKEEELLDMVRWRCRRSLEQRRKSCIRESRTILRSERVWKDDRTEEECRGSCLFINEMKMKGWDGGDGALICLPHKSSVYRHLSLPHCSLPLNPPYLRFFLVSFRIKKIIIRSSSLYKIPCSRKFIIDPSN